MMRDEAAASLRFEHLVGERELFGHRPIRRDIRGIHVLVRPVAGRFAICKIDGAEAVHLTVVVFGLKRFEVMTDVDRILERIFHQLDDSVFAFVAGRTVGARKRRDKLSKLLFS
ncbi:MAG: hypothetical protein ABIZ82_12340 [Candidatus Tumulicola sp.]